MHLTFTDHMEPALQSSVGLYGWHTCKAANYQTLISGAVVEAKSSSTQHFKLTYALVENSWQSYTTRVFHIFIIYIIFLQ